MNHGLVRAWRRRELDDAPKMQITRYPTICLIDPIFTRSGHVGGPRLFVPEIYSGEKIEQIVHYTRYFSEKWSMSLACNLDLSNKSFFVLHRMSWMWAKVLLELPLPVYPNGPG